MTLAGVAGIMPSRGSERAHLGGTVVAALLLIYVAVAHKVYRWRRISAFDPWADPQAQDTDHPVFLARQRRGRPVGKEDRTDAAERHSTSSAVIGEELGLIGALAVLLLFCIILWRGVKISLATTEPFSRMLALGITLLISLQGMINMAVVTGLLPTKGIALPLVSYGGSSSDSMRRWECRLYFERNRLKEFTAVVAEVAEE
jgi:cell division protein FtsW